MNTNTAVIFLLASVVDEADGGRVDRALRLAFAGALESLEQNIDVPDVEERREELSEHLRDWNAELAAPLTRETWLLVFSHLDADAQRLFQRAYEDLMRAAEASAGTGATTEQESSAMHVALALAPVEELLLELPHTTLVPSRGRDDHDERRRTLTPEVQWQAASDDDPVCVVWRDGYETLIASMSLMLHEGLTIWRLVFADAQPGRSVEHRTPRADGTAREIAEATLPDALRWASDELRPEYAVKSEPPA